MKALNIRFLVNVTQWEPDVFSSHGMNIHVRGKILVPEFGWDMDFQIFYSPRNSSWPFESLYLEGKKVTEKSPWWEMFMCLHEEGLLGEP